ncbi:MAG: nucleoside-diphosphate kinase [Bacteroidales bacterium]|jgi:nucleoside-diphosphate kinase|nr:nucleoside-diphosphate kinase [Bacteroidales bacterium]
MAEQITFSMIKPYAFHNNFVGGILAIINKAGFRISAIKTEKFTKSQAESFYEIHKDKAFFDELIEFMISGPIVAMILEKENAVEDFRKLIGNTNPEKAKEGTIRKMFADSIERNAIHGADSVENAIRECDFFFAKKDRY